jgi:hypothetical protein
VTSIKKKKKEGREGGKKEIRIREIQRKAS